MQHIIVILYFFYIFFLLIYMKQVARFNNRNYLTLSYVESKLNYEILKDKVGIHNYVYFEETRRIAVDIPIIQ